MKQSTAICLKEVTNTDLNKLLTQVKETLDISSAKASQKVFNRVSLWNVYKQKRTFSSRRFM